MGSISRQRSWVGAWLAACLGWAAPTIGDEGPSWVGTGSCAATACHGGRREPLGLKGSEYGFSQAYDPHARAFAVLYDDRSRRIEKAYRRLASVELARATEDDLCLRCHVHQGFDSRRDRGFEVADGVGCESCHGAAGRWLVPHSEYGFRSLSDRRKFDLFGLRPAKDLLARGNACAECHVGIDDADVNHDLIAAGHPRLNFEYGSQLAKLPKHWPIEDDRSRHPDYEAKVWALGQILTAKASLDLLAARATRSIPENSTTPWPEFAESSCFGCHRDLTPNLQGRDRLTAGGLPGSIRWGSWAYPMLPVADSAFPAPPRAVDLGPIGVLMADPVPEPAVVARRARAASEELGRRADALNRGTIRPSEIRSMLGLALKDANPVDWDRSAQQYLAIVALDRASAGSGDRPSREAVRAGLGRWLGDLDLPGRDPALGALFDSPRRFDAGKVRADLGSVRSALSHP